MSLELAETLARLADERQRQTIAKGWGTVPSWVFCNEQGGLLDPDNLRHRVFYKALKAAKLRKVRFHDLRHTFASLLLQQGESLTSVVNSGRHRVHPHTAGC